MGERTERIFSATDFDVDNLVDLKLSRDLSISVCVPTLNEAGNILNTIAKLSPLQNVLIDELIVVDGGSTDDTVSLAQACGIAAYQQDDILSDFNSVATGKGGGLWKSLHVMTSDIVCWVDGDVIDIDGHYVVGLVGPLLTDTAIKFVKGCYRRPLVGYPPLGGGRVTELLARPLLSICFPELMHIVQPLSGEFAGYRHDLRHIPMTSGYAVDVQTLVYITQQLGIQAIGQVDLGSKRHSPQSLDRLSVMAREVALAILSSPGGVAPDGIDLSLRDYVQPTLASDLGSVCMTTSPGSIAKLPPIAYVDSR